jgi:hypothetical protein
VFDFAFNFSGPISIIQEFTTFKQKLLCKICGFTAVTMKNAIFWDVSPRGSCKNQCFGGIYRLHHQGDKNQ